MDAIRLVEEKVNPNLGVDSSTSTTATASANNDPQQVNNSNNEAPSEQETVLANALRQTAVPLDMLDMMDANSLNPDCFARGLLSESLRQFSNLQSRKASMNMLAQLVEKGFEERERGLKIAAVNAADGNTNEKVHTSKEEEGKLGNSNANNEEGNDSKKRKRDEDDVGDDDTSIQPVKKEMKM